MNIKLSYDLPEQFRKIASTPLRSLSVVCVSLVVGLSQLSCERTEEREISPSFEIDENSGEYVIEIDSTRFVSEDISYFSTIHETTIAGVSKDGAKIVIYDFKIDSLRELDLMGEGPGKTDRIFDVSILRENVIFVMDQINAYVYDFDGTLISKCGPLANKVNYGRSVHAIPISGDKVAFAAINPMVEVENVNYFNNEDNFQYATLNINSCELKYGGILGQDNLYRENFYAVRMRPILTRLNNEFLISLMPFNDKLEFINASNFELENSVRLISENFDADYFANVNSLEEQSKIIQLNSSYRHLLASDDGEKLLVQYKRGTEDYISPEDLMGSSKGTKIGANKYFELYSLKNKQKMGNDILAPSNLIPLYYQSDHLLLFYSTIHDEKEGLYLHFGHIRSS